MADSSRIEDLRRRVQKDPASIAFAQLGEELRRAGRSKEAIETCRAGLAHHPTYVSARVTLGRSLLEIGETEQAEQELTEVLRLAPENLAALRGVAEALERRGDLAAALSHYESALALAPRDGELQQTVASLRGQVVAVPEPAAAPVAAEPRNTPSSFHEFVASAAPRDDGPAAPTDEAPSALPALERWLDAIVADREQRAAHRA